MTERSRLRWKNISGETMPAGAIFQIKEYIPAERAFEADKWDGEANRWGINGQVDVDDDGYGWFDRSLSEYIVLHDTDNVPEFGRNCGPEDGQWWITSKGGGFRFYGEASGDFLTGVEFIGRDILKVKLQAALDEATDSDTTRTSVTAYVRDWTSGGDLSTSSREITVHNHYEGIDFDDQTNCTVIWDVIEWHILAADCPS